MSTVRTGNQAALVIVDVQVSVVNDAWETKRVVSNVARLVERARENQVPVIWVQHDDEELVRDSPSWQLVPELVPAQGEARIYKHFESSFEETGLEAELSRVSATHIVLAGAATNWCIRATAYGALDRGYDLTLVKDAHTTKTLELEDGQKIEAAGVVADLNVAMKWISYPGRKNGTAAAEEVDFATPGGVR